MEAWGMLLGVGMVVRLARRPLGAVLRPFLSGRRRSVVMHSILRF